MRPLRRPTRKQIDEALKKSEEKFAKIFRASPLLIALIRVKDHSYIEVNETFERITGWKRDEVIGRTPDDIGIWTDPGQRAEIAKRLFAGETVRNVEIRVRVKNGEIRTGLASAELIEMNGEQEVLCIAGDITELKRTESELRDSEERFRLAMNNVASGVYTLDLQGLVTYVNPAAEAMFGWTNAELLGRKMHDVTHYKHPDGTPFPASDCPGLQVLQTGRELREHEDVFIRKDCVSSPLFSVCHPLIKAAKRLASSLDFATIRSGEKQNGQCVRVKNVCAWRRRREGCTPLTGTWSPT